jgi:hypothetical protein
MERPMVMYIYIDLDATLTHQNHRTSDEAHRTAKIVKHRYHHRGPQLATLAILQCAKRRKCYRVYVGGWGGVVSMGISWRYFRGGRGLYGSWRC